MRTYAQDTRHEMCSRTLTHHEQLSGGRTIIFARTIIFGAKRDQHSRAPYDCNCYLLQLLVGHTILSL